MKKKRKRKLEKVRKIDDTAYICVYCYKITTGWGARISKGWACSGDCYDAECREYENKIMNKTNIYSFYWDCGRQGSVEGMFLPKKQKSKNM